MYRKDFLDREFEKLGILLATILGLKKSGKSFTEVEEATKTGLKNILGDNFDLGNTENDTNVFKLTPEKQQALADTLFELGLLAHQQNNIHATKQFLTQYLRIIALAEENSHTFSFQNLSNKALSEKILSEI